MRVAPKPPTDAPEPEGDLAPPPEGPRSPRAIAWVRRRRALAQFWRTYRKSPMGVVGLVIMVAFVLLAILAPLLINERGLSVSFATGKPLQPPSASYPLGTDNFGRSVLTLVIYGSKTSLIVGFAATVVAMLIGSAVGIVSGYYGRTVDTILNALTNWFLVIPWIALAIVLAAILGASLLNIILVIGITSWAGTARLVRAQTLTVKERPYVERARALGASDRHLVRRHILPNVFPVIFANTILTVALAILSETTLALLGLGDPNTVSWGGIINDAFEAGALTSGQWWWIIPPGVAICLVVLAFTMCGYALDEVINPRLRSR